MAKVVTDNQYYKAIADAIRALLNSNNTYTPAQMAPAIIGYIAGGIDLSDVESYFISEVVNAMKYVKELGTDNWVHHIVITDTHYCRNYNHSEAIVDAMQDSGYFSKIIHLGDLIDSDQEENELKAVEVFGKHNGNMMFVIGNHDAQGTYDWQTYWYNHLLSNDTDLVIDQSDNYNYYWDDSAHSIRYIVYHYGSAGATYAVERVKDAPSGYAVITLCHYKDLITSSILVPLLGHGVNYIGNMTGHYHIDGYNTSYAGMFNQVFLNNDGNINDNANYVKEDGTVNSQAITIMSINTSTKNVKFYRIGIPTTLGKRWDYTYVQGGSINEWLNGYYWGTGTTTASDTGYISLKRYPVYDGNGNEITYYYYSRSGTLNNTYTLLLNTSGDWISPQRQSRAFSDVWARRGGIVKSQAFANAGNAGYYLISFAISDLTSTDDIVITTERPNLGRAYGSSLWQTGVYLNSSGGEKTDDATAATTYAFDVNPSTTYRFYVDDGTYSGSSYMCAFVYGSVPENGAGMGFKLKRRLGQTSGSWTEITFTTNADEYYCRISIMGITTLTDFASKCKLEVVTA